MVKKPAGHRHNLLSFVMDTGRIAVLLEPFLERPLAESQLAQISTYIDLLLRWNARINLTAIRNQEEIVTRHFGESLFLARHLFPAGAGGGLREESGEELREELREEFNVARAPSPANSDGVRSSGAPSSSAPCHPERRQDKNESIALAQSKDPCQQTLARSSRLVNPLATARVIDIGSGAGFPGIPLKIWQPQIHLTLIESNHKKSAFLREITREITLTNVDVISERAEVLAERSDLRAQVVTLRAVERFTEVLPLASGFVAPAGKLALLIGTAQLAELERAPFLRWNPPISVPGSDARVLSVGRRT